MKRWDNKGFAITTVVYGLSIMGILVVSMLMAIMSSERSNNNQISKTIEDELNRYSKTDTSFSASGSGVPTAQEYVVPFGESGWYRIELWGAAQGGTSGEPGAYTSGIIRLEDGDVLYFYVGSQLGGTSGGQSTDVRIVSGPYSGPEEDKSALRSYETRIMIAAGGGGGAGASGGASFISGYAGCNAVVAGVPTNNPKYIYRKFTYNSEGEGSYSSTGREYYFLDGKMLAGNNEGHGRAHIEKVVADDPDSETNEKSKLPILNQKLMNVTSITDCVKEGQGNDMDQTVIRAVSNGDYVTLVPFPKSYKTVGSVNLVCKKVNLTSTTNLDEIAVWHPGMSGKNIKNHYIYVNDSIALKTPSGNPETEDATGYHISAYQPG